MGHNPSWEFLKMNEQAMTSPLILDDVMGHNPSWEFLKMNEQAMTSPLILGRVDKIKNQPS